VHLRTRLEDVPGVIGDRVQLQQVALNLVINAVEAMRSVEHPRLLNIQTSVDGDSVLVQVADSGPGIDAEHIDKIFNPFFTTKREGIGMGLTISRSIVETHGGRMWATTAKPGARFNLALPRAAANEGK